MTPVLVPDLGEGVAVVEIAAWHFIEGAYVRQEQDLVELVTDKASFNVQSPASGVLKKVYFKAGQEARVGEILGEIE